ncbi:MAG: formylmethanofuran dehydrogenase, partial [Hyphomicrobiaceae bacterium]
TPAVLAALRTLLRDAPATSTGSAAVPLAALHDLAERCRTAHYAVFVWAPQALDFAEADSTVHMIAEVVRDLNKTTRAAGLSLGGDDGGASAASVCSWQSGYPLRVSFAGGKPAYDPYRFEIARMLEAGEGDLLVWTSSFGPALPPPPATRVPLIVLGAAGVALGQTPDVFIPVGTPGLDHGGRLVRCDGVVSLPLRALRVGGVPSVAEVATSLADGLPPVAATAAE